MRWLTAAWLLALLPPAAPASHRLAERLGTHHIYSGNHTLEACREARGPFGLGRSADCAAADNVHCADWGRGRQLHGTALAQELLHHRQNPADCAAARFLLATPHPGGGIGSQLVFVGIALVAAENMGRVLVMPRDPDNVLYDKAFCGPHSNFDACYFRPLSACQTEALYAELAGGAPTPIGTYKEATESTARFIQLTHRMTTELHRMLPSGQSMQQLVNAAPLPEPKRAYWWRAQAVAFIVRPNRRALHMLRKARAAYFQGQSIPPGAISVHVRRGDKATEFPHTRYEKYLEAAEEIAALQPSVPRTLFLSSESQAAVEWFLANASGWRVLATNIPRANDAVMPEFIKARPAGVLFDSLLNLELALECAHFVGTLSSNWCALIDQLRSSSACKAEAHFLDPAQPFPPPFLGYLV